MTAKPRQMIAKSLQFLLLASISSIVMAQGLEAPPIVIRSNTQSGVLWAQDRAGAPTNNATVQVQSTGGGGAQGASVNATGANLSINSSTVTQPASMVVAGDLPCPGQSKSWTVGGATCTAAFPTVLSGANASATDSVQPVVGSANFTCTSGAWSVAPAAGATCAATTCAAATLSWVGGTTCSASFPLANSGEQHSRASTAGGSGSAAFTCSAGAWTLTSNGGCTAPLGSLPSDVVVWDSPYAPNDKAGYQSRLMTSTVGALGGGKPGHTVRFYLHDGTYIAKQPVDKWSGNGAAGGGYSLHSTLGGISPAGSRCALWGTYAVVCR